MLISLGPHVDVRTNSKVILINVELKLSSRLIGSDAGLKPWFRVVFPVLDETESAATSFGP